MADPQKFSTPPLNVQGVDFRRNDFNALVWQKGYSSIIDHAVYCPCRGTGAHPKSDCHNCGGNGWVFVNPYEERLVMHSMNLQTNLRAWSEETLGTVSISAM